MPQLYLFVKNGFYLPVAKGFASWIDAGTLFVSTDFGEGSMTDSGYPRIVKRWKRGTPLAAAEQALQQAKWLPTNPTQQAATSGGLAC